MLGGAHAQKVEVWGRVNGAFGEREAVRIALSATWQRNRTGKKIDAEP